LDILTIACVNPVKHYKVSVGLLQQGDPADMILVDNLNAFNIQSTWIGGQQIFNGLRVDLPEVIIPEINSFGISPLDVSMLDMPLRSGPAKIIVAIDGALVTEEKTALVSAGNFESDIQRDILKMVVINRYTDAPSAMALIHGFGMKTGAIASSVAHDSHNIVAVGTNDLDLAACINAVIRHKGGVAASRDMMQVVLPLPIAGLMSNKDGESVGTDYEKVDAFVKTQLGSALTAPFMTLSFMALLVIPSLKLSDKGLFDGLKFQFTPLQ
jgi:adenine deaminase